MNIKILLFRRGRPSSFTAGLKLYNLYTYSIKSTYKNIKNVKDESILDVGHKINIKTIIVLSVLAARFSICGATSIRGLVYCT
jgi:hypothetical protein